MWDYLSSCGQRTLHVHWWFALIHWSKLKRRCKLTLSRKSWKSSMYIAWRACSSFSCLSKQLSSISTILWCRQHKFSSALLSKVSNIKEASFYLAIKQGLHYPRNLAELITRVSKFYTTRVSVYKMKSAVYKMKRPFTKFQLKNWPPLSGFDGI